MPFIMADLLSDPRPLRKTQRSQVVFAAREVEAGRVDCRGYPYPSVLRCLAVLVRDLLRGGEHWAAARIFGNHGTCYLGGTASARTREAPPVSERGLSARADQDSPSSGPNSRRVVPWPIRLDSFRSFVCGTPR